MMEDNGEKSKEPPMPLSVFDCVIDYIVDPLDRDTVSLVCKSWYQIDAQSRKHITIGLCYSTTPQAVGNRFMFLESLKLKGEPRVEMEEYMFDWMPQDWGGRATPWVNELATSFTLLKALHFWRMIVTDADLEHIAITRGNILHTLKLDMCSGFSTDGLRHITRSCMGLKTLSLEGSTIDDYEIDEDDLDEDGTIPEIDGEWLQELALNNTVLETLNLYNSNITRINIQNLEVLARNCPSLVSFKISYIPMQQFIGFVEAATALQEFYVTYPNQYVVAFPIPPKLCSLGLQGISEYEMPIIFPFAARLTRLILDTPFLDENDMNDLIPRCPNLEVFEARMATGDVALELLGQFCKKLRRIRIDGGIEDLGGSGPEEGYISHEGLTALAQGCLELEYFDVYVSDITNACLECMGTHWKRLKDFRLVLLSHEPVITDLPLDNGVRALLQGCDNLRRFALYLRPGALTDTGLGYIGRYSVNVSWMLLGCVGESDEGILEFSQGCPKLQKLEMRACPFTERALAIAVTRLTSLRYFWVQGHIATQDGRDLTAMARPFWNIELVNGTGHVLAYYSIAGPRTDCPNSVVPFDPLLG